MDRGRFELPTSSLQMKRSTNWANGPDCCSTYTGQDLDVKKNRLLIESDNYKVKNYYYLHPRKTAPWFWFKLIFFIKYSELLKTKSVLYGKF